MKVYKRAEHFHYTESSRNMLMKMTTAEQSHLCQSPRRRPRQRLSSSLPVVHYAQPRPSGFAAGFNFINILSGASFFFFCVQNTFIQKLLVTC